MVFPMSDDDYLLLWMLGAGAVILTLAGITVILICS